MVRQPIVYTDFAPITGAWIETQSVVPLFFFLASHPSRVRGLKLAKLIDQRRYRFAPITGAWIETGMFVYYVPAASFAPITGAWIETIAAYVHSHPNVRTHHGCVD